MLAVGVAHRTARTGAQGAELLDEARVVPVSCRPRVESEKDKQSMSVVDDGHQGNGANGVKEAVLALTLKVAGKGPRVHLRCELFSPSDTDSTYRYSGVSVAIMELTSLWDLPHGEL